MSATTTQQPARRALALLFVLQGHTMEGLRLKLAPDASELDACRTLGETLARHLVGEAMPREVDLASLS